MQKNGIKTRVALGKDIRIERRNRKPTAEELRSIFNYDPSTGVLTWKVSPSTNVQIGDVAGNIHSSQEGYTCWMICVFGKKYKAHRVIWCLVTGEWPTSLIDHRNCLATDNRWENLRIATDAQNSQNSRRPATNTSGFKGACFNKRNKKWFAQIKKDKKRHFLGFYETPEDAHEAYCLAADLLFGEYANHGEIDPAYVDASVHRGTT
jgi:hypothetical protein